MNAVAVDGQTARGVGGRAPPSTPQFIPRTPDGPAVAAPSTDTEWLTHTLGFASFGARNDTPTGLLSDGYCCRGVRDSGRVQRGESIGMAPAVGICERVSTLNDQPQDWALLPHRVVPRLSRSVYSAFLPVA